MGETIRFGVSMDSDLVNLLDKITEQNHHDNRSETIRDLVRNEIIKESSEDDAKEVIGTLTLLFHHKTQLPRSPIGAFPSLTLTANLQFHIEGDIVAKIIVVKGKGGEIKQWAQKLTSARRIIGKLAIAATADLLDELTL